MSSTTEQRKLSAIMFTDMVGYSGLAQRNERLALELLEEHRALLRSVFPKFNGTEIKTIGDGFLVEFHSALEAAQCAIKIQRALANRNHDAPADRRIELRVGIHIGDVVHRGGDVYGDGVNIASRIERLANPGGICVSMDVERQIRNALEARLEKLAPTELKNISVPMDLFRIVLPWEKQAPVVVKSETVSTPTSRKALTAAAALLLLLLIGFGWRWSDRPRRTSLSPAATSTPDTVDQKSIAVLPFENLSDDKANAYFAEGIQDEILTKLGSIADLKVISRTSTAKYKSKPEDLKTVSQQLGVANVVEGTVQRAADEVRVNVQLIDARADTHLWAKSYDRDIKDVFAVESEVSQEIADALQARLSPNETNTLASAPTKDPEAYDFFLKGEYEEREALDSRKLENFEQAATWYRQAIARDPQFALAMASLAENEVLRHWWLKPLSDGDLDKVRSRAQQALSLAPDLAQGHIALGAYYSLGKRQFEQALAEFGRALELQPNNVRALIYAAGIHRRQGLWTQYLSELTKCQQLDPRDPQIPVLMGATYCRLRMWEQANRAGQRALALDPRNMTAMVHVLLPSLEGTGDIEKATRLLATFPADALIAQSFKVGGDVSNIIGIWPYFYVIKRDYPAALKAWDKDPSEAPTNRLPARAAIFVLAGDSSSAHEEIESTRELVEARLRERPDDGYALSQLSWIYVALQRNSEAVKVAQHLAELIPPEKDAVEGPEILANLAEIEARTGDTSAAVKTLRQVLLLPAGMVVSIERLKIDPVWDPIRNDPGFQQLLAGKEQIGPNK
jgi:adenylate cyclase